MKHLENSEAKINHKKKTERSEPSAGQSLVNVLPILAVLAGVTGACQSEEGRHKPDNSNINTVEQKLNENNIVNVDEVIPFGWSQLGDTGLQIIKKDGRYIALFNRSAKKYFVIADSMNDLHSSSLVPQIVGNTDNLQAGAIIYLASKDKVIANGTKQTTEDIQSYELEVVGNMVSFVNKQDACSSHLGIVGRLGTGSEINTGKVITYEGTEVTEVNVDTCETISTALNPEAGTPDQDPTGGKLDGMYTKGIQYTPGYYQLASAPTLDDFVNNTNITPWEYNNNPILGKDVGQVIDNDIVYTYFSTDTGFKDALIYENCGDGICKPGENATTCAADCEVPPVCGDGNVEGTEFCDDENCNANCDDCNPGYELSGNLCVAQIPDQDPDLSDTTDADPDTVADTIDDTDTFEDTDQTPDTPDEDTPETTDTPDQDTSETDTTPDQSNPEIIIDPNCDPTRIAVTDVLDSGSGVEVLCPGSPVFAEIKGNGTLSLTLHEGISPATVQIGDMEGNEGKIIINESVKEGEKSAEMDQIYGYYRFQEDEKLANGQPQLEVNYRVTGAIMTFSPIGTIFEMDKKSLDQNNIKYAGRVIESSVLATVFDENDKLLYTRVFQEGDEIYFTNTSLKSLCNESLSDFCKVIVTEDTSEGAETLEGEDTFTDTSVDKKDPGGCTCIVKSADGKLEVIPAALGLAVLGIIMQLRRRKGSEQ